MNPLGPEDLIDLQRAVQRTKRVRKACGVAAFSAWTTGGFALLAVPFALMSPASLLVGIGLGVVAFNEFRGLGRLRRFDPAASRLLGFNQVGFATLLIAYAVWSLAGASRSGTGAMLGMDPALQSMYQTIMFGVYGGLIGGAVFFQGGLAWYYFTRRRHIEAYLEKTPDWIVQVQRVLEGEPVDVVTRPTQIRKAA